MGKLKPLVDAIRDSGDSVAVHARRLSELPGNHRNKVDDVRSKAENTDNSAARGDGGSGGGGGGGGDGRNPVLGPHHDTVLEAHNANPDWVAHPDEWRIVEGAELKRARREYQQMVRNGELPTGHHRLGLADGGTNTADNIQFTGESTIAFDKFSDGGNEWYAEAGYGQGTQIAKIHQLSEGGLFVFGANPDHTSVTNLQNLVHNWQKSVGLRS
jgi:hypothetical protein